MYDNSLRTFKDKLVRSGKIHNIKLNPLTYTLIGFVLGILSIYFIISSNLILGLVFWILNRSFDGIDGSIARINNQTSKLGSYLDIVFDFIIYSGIIVGFIFINLSSPAIIISGSILLALYYINSIAWTYFEILDESTHTKPKKFLIEGFETIIFYILFFVLYQYLLSIFLVFGGLILLTILQRIKYALQEL
jgi:phosphatidylglycerophosphate synthase